MDSNIGIFFQHCPDTLTSTLTSSLSGISPAAPARYSSFDLTCSEILASPKRRGSDDWDDEAEDDDEDDEEEDWEDEDFDDEDFDDEDEFDYEDDDDEEYYDDEDDIDLDDDDDA